MARIYYLSSTNSDLTGGIDFNKHLTSNIATASTISPSSGFRATEISSAYTQILHPGSAGTVTGDYTVTIDVTVANSNAFVSVQIHRINSTGTIQTSSATNAEEQISSTGKKTFTLSSVDLGTFASTDRLRVDYIIRNSARGNTSITIATDDVDSSIITPFVTRQFSIS
jgi:hypothetical protein